MDQVDVLFDQQLLEGRVAVWIDPRAKPVVGAGVQHAFLARAAMPVDHRLPGPMRTGVKQVKVVLAGQCHAKLVGVQLGAAPGALAADAVSHHQQPQPLRPGPGRPPPGNSGRVAEDGAGAMAITMLRQHALARGAAQGKRAGRIGKQLADQAGGFLRIAREEDFLAGLKVRPDRRVVGNGDLRGADGCQLEQSVGRRKRRPRDPLLLKRRLR